LGVREALVVHGSGLDEVALHGATSAIRLSNGALKEMELTPEQAGIERAPLQAVAGGDPRENAERLRALLLGGGHPAERDIVTLNAAALLLAAGRAENLRAGAVLARDALARGRAGRLLDDFVEASRG
jgi:anthranilate phosphoribosyltransferase